MSITTYPWNDDPRQRGAVGDFIDRDVPGLRWVRRAGGGYGYEVFVSRTKTTKQLQKTLSSTDWPKGVLAEYDVWRGKRAAGETTIVSGVNRMDDLYAELERDLQRKIGNGNRKDKTLENRERDYRLYIKPTLGTTPVRDVDVVDVVELYDYLLNEYGLANNTVRNVHQTMRQLFIRASKLRWIVQNPMHDVERDDVPAKVNKRETTICRVQDLARVIQQVRPIYLDMLIVCAYTGLRVSELVGLVWDDIDFTNRRIYVRQQLLRPTGKPAYRAGPKGRAGRETRSKRTVLMLPRTFQALTRQLQRERAKGLGNDSDFVFTTRALGSVTQSNFRNRGVKEAGRKAGLGNHLTPHSLRHSTASILKQAGIPDHVAARMMGHTEEEYRSTYVHTFEDEQEFAEMEAALLAVGYGAEEEVGA